MSEDFMARVNSYEWHIRQAEFHSSKNGEWHARQERWHRRKAKELGSLAVIAHITVRKNKSKFLRNLRNSNALLKRLQGI